MSPSARSNANQALGFFIGYHSPLGVYLRKRHVSPFVSQQSNYTGSGTGCEIGAGSSATRSSPEVRSM